MAEEIHVKRLRSLRYYDRQLLAHGIHTEHGAGKRAEPTGVGNRDGECVALHTSHRGLNDRKLNSKELLQGHLSGLDSNCRSIGTRCSGSSSLIGIITAPHRPLSKSATVHPICGMER